MAAVVVAARKRLMGRRRFLNDGMARLNGLGMGNFERLSVLRDSD